MWFAEKQPRVFRRLVTKSDGERSQWEYPFAAAGVNVTFQLLDLLELRDATKMTGVGGVSSEENTVAPSPPLTRVPAPASPAGASFVDCLDAEDDAFEKVYVAWFEVLDREWLARRAGVPSHLHTFTHIQSDCQTVALRSLTLFIFSLGASHLDAVFSGDATVRLSDCFHSETHTALCNALTDAPIAASTRHTVHRSVELK